MALILDRLPIPTRDTVAFVGQEAVTVHAYEIPVWVCLAVGDVMDARRLPRFPALLDTAHTHHFLIREEHLWRWAGLRPDALHLGWGSIRQQGRRFPLRAAQLWMHPNLPGHWDRPAGRPPHRIYVPEGIVVYPPGSSFPRLPLVGLRAIVRNKLDPRVRGKDGMVSLRSGVKWWPFG
jgi:hypothetical protein